jgi:hypothetical protein
LDLIATMSKSRGSGIRVGPLLPWTLPTQKNIDVT